MTHRCTGKLYLFSIPYVWNMVRGLSPLRTEQPVTFVGDKLKRVAEYSEARAPLLRAVVHKLVAQAAPTFTTQHLGTQEHSTPE